MAFEFFHTHTILSSDAKSIVLTILSASNVILEEMLGSNSSTLQWKR